MPVNGCAGKKEVLPSQAPRPDSAEPETEAAAQSKDEEGALPTAVANDLSMARGSDNREDALGNTATAEEVRLPQNDSSTLKGRQHKGL